jgi:hypothetical protein
MVFSYQKCHSQNRTIVLCYGDSTSGIGVLLFCFENGTSGTKVLLFCYENGISGTRVLLFCFGNENFPSNSVLRRVSTDQFVLKDYRYDVLYILNGYSMD